MKVKKLLTVAAVAAALALPLQSAQAWWGPWGGWGPWDGWGDGWGGFDFHMGGGGWGRGYGYPYYGYPYYGGYGGYPYLGYPAWGGYPYAVAPVAPAAKAESK